MPRYPPKNLTAQRFIGNRLLRLSRGLKRGPRWMSMGHAGAYDKDLFVVNHPARSGGVKHPWDGQPPCPWLATPAHPPRGGQPPVPLVSHTAYPRLEPAPSPAEVVRLTPTLAEIAFVHRRTRQPGPRLALLRPLKPFQGL